MKNIIKLILVLVIFPNTWAVDPGSDVMGPDTMGQPTYPNSGQLRSRSNDITGEDMSDSTMSSNQDPTVPTPTPKIKQSQEEGAPIKIRDAYPIGPFDNTQANESK